LLLDAVLSDLQPVPEEGVAMDIHRLRLWLDMERLERVCASIWKSSWQRSQKEEPMLKCATILCVDDDPQVLHTTEVILRRAGHIVAGAANAADAIQLLKACRFDLLLLDYVPAFARLTGEARRLHRDVRIIVCTGDPSCSELPLVDAVLHKPLPPPVFLEKISELLNAATRAA
jgi:CheY-like chemotaxis protein